MVVLRRTCNSAYCLAELDSTVFKLCYAAFHLVPYFSCSQLTIPVTHLLDCNDIMDNDIADDDTEQDDNKA